MSLLSRSGSVVVNGFESAGMKNAGNSFRFRMFEEEPDYASFVKDEGSASFSSISKSVFDLNMQRERQHQDKHEVVIRKEIWTLLLKCSQSSSLAACNSSSSKSSNHFRRKSLVLSEENMRKLMNGFAMFMMEKMSLAVSHPASVEEFIELVQGKKDICTILSRVCDALGDVYESTCDIWSVYDISCVLNRTSEPSSSPLKSSNADVDVVSIHGGSTSPSSLEAGSCQQITSTIFARDKESKEVEPSIPFPEKVLIIVIIIFIYLFRVHVRIMLFFLNQRISY